MIEKIKIVNFKSLKDIELDFRKVNILFGPNNAGKSSILQAIAFLAQQDPRRGVTFNGDLVSLGSFLGTVFNKKAGQTMEIELTLGLRDKEHEEIKEKTRRNAYGNFDLSSIKVKASLSYDAIIHPSLSLYSRDEELIGERIWTNGTCKVRYNQRINEEEFDGRTTGVSLFGWDARPHKPSGAKFCPVVCNTVKEIGERRILGQIYYFAPFRMVSARNEGINSKPERVDPNGEKSLASLFYTRMWQEPQFNKIVKWVKEFNIFDLRSEFLEESKTKASFRDDVLPVSLDPIEIGFGSNQLFPVIVQSFNSSPGSIITVEEPEMSLHPSSEVKLPYLFSEIVKDDKQIIATTHSEFLPLALGKAIKEGELSKDEVALYELKKGEEGTEKEELELDENGRISGWIPEFRKVEDELIEEWDIFFPKEEE